MCNFLRFNPTSYDDPDDWEPTVNREWTYCVWCLRVTSCWGSWMSRTLHVPERPSCMELEVLWLRACCTFWPPVSFLKFWFPVLFDQIRFFWSFGRNNVIPIPAEVHLSHLTANINFVVAVYDFPAVIGPLVYRSCKEVVWRGICWFHAHHVWILVGLYLTDSGFQLQPSCYHRAFCVSPPGCTAGWTTLSCVCSRGSSRAA